MIVTGNIVGSIPPAVRNGLASPEGSRLITFLLILGGLNILGLLVGFVQGIINWALTDRFNYQNRHMILDATLSPLSVAHMESPEFANEIALSQGSRGARLGRFPNSVTGLLGVALRVVGSVVLLLSFRWWVPLVLLLGIYAVTRYLRRELAMFFTTLERNTEDQRRSDYYRDLALQAPGAKELRVFGLSKWIRNRMSDHWMTAMREIWATRRKSNPELVITGCALGLVFGVTYVAMGRAGLSGEISLTQLSIYAQAGLALLILVAQGDARRDFENGVNVIGHLLGLKEKAEALDLTVTGRAIECKGLPKSEIRFDGIGFAYPGSSTKIFESFDFRIPAGQSVAIVGRNGAGKTTLVKLLARLYHPMEGRILVDGIPITEFDPKEWRRQLSIIFQDFIRYSFSARDNIAVGDLQSASRDDLLSSVASKAGIKDLIDTLPNGWDTTLSKEFRGGTDLSGGQWQRVALARAIFGAQTGGVLILDEPTANLDVRGEAEVFDRFLELTRGLTTILISHRFSTVRRADRICVLEEGRIIEDGTHEELIALNGRYAQMFNLQASRFVTDG
jgi:ATP-binding cassette subfamily B protein